MAGLARALTNKLKIRNVTVHTGSGDVTMSNEGVVVVNKSSGAATAVTLTPAPESGDVVWVIDGKGDAATNNITVSGAAAETINGSSSHVLSENYGSVCFVYNGTEWNIGGQGLSVSAAEIGFVNGVTAGTAAASKAVVLDGSKGIATITSATITTVTTGTVSEVTAASGVTIDSGVIRDGQFHGVQGAPTAETGVATISIADILSGIVTLTHATGSTVALTLDTGTAMDTGMPASFGTNQFIDWYLINLSAAAADTGTLTAASGHTIVGNPIIQSAHSSTGGIYGNSAHFRSRRTASNTWITYRVA